MVLQINGESLLECNEEDIQLLIDDPTFRENDHIDYKENFAFLEIQEKNEKIRRRQNLEMMFALLLMLRVDI